MPSPLKQANVLDYLPASEHAALRAGRSTHDCTDGIQAAIDAAARSEAERLGHGSPPCEPGPGRSPIL